MFFGETDLAAINLKKKLIQVKIVYYGPGRGGKTTNLEYIYNKFRHKMQSELISIKTQGDRTLFFDFLPIGIGKIRGYDIRIQLYTVPGQVRYNATRRLVLNGVDGIVFVGDSMVIRKERNLLSIKNLEENLLLYKIDISKIPLVMQYNKRDLSEKGITLLDIEDMEHDLNSKLKAPFFPASALGGQNVVATLKMIVALTLNKLKNELK
jgi:mutual gliding-motility protein MglA